MKVVTLAGIKNSSIYVTRLKERLTALAPKSLGAHVIRNEIDRVTGTANRNIKPGAGLNEYRNYLASRLTSFPGNGIVPKLIRKEIEMIGNNTFTGTTAGSISGIYGKKKKKKGFFKKLGAGLKKFGKFQKKLALAPARNAALSLIVLNFRGLASKLARATNKEKISKKWTRLGGNPKKLWNTVKSGNKKKPLLGGKKHAKKPMPVKGLAGLDDMIIEIPAINGGVGAVQLAAVIALATPIIAAIAGMVGKGKGSGEGGAADAALAAEEGGTLQEITDLGTEAAAAAGMPAELPAAGKYSVTDADEEAPAGAGEPTGDEEIDAKNAPTGFSLSPKVMMIGTAAVLAAAFLLSKKSSKN